VDTLLNWEKTINMREFRSICSSKVSKVCGQMPRAVPAYRICL
jgi:hypothetical protein